MPTGPGTASWWTAPLRCGRLTGRASPMWRRASRRVPRSSCAGWTQRAPPRRSHGSRRAPLESRGRPTAKASRSTCWWTLLRIPSGASTCRALQTTRNGRPRRASWSAWSTAGTGRAGHRSDSGTSSWSQPMAEPPDRSPTDHTITALPHGRQTARAFCSPASAPKMPNTSTGNPKSTQWMCTPVRWSGSPAAVDRTEIPCLHRTGAT